MASPWRNSATRAAGRARKCELPFRRINPLNLGRCAPFDDELGERAVAAADVDPAQASERRQPIEKDLARKPAPGSHHPLVGRAVVEADLRFGHQYPPPFGPTFPRDPV
jgi:hypothetical protein